MLVYSSVFTSFQSCFDSDANAWVCEESSNAIVVASAAPVALKKPLRDRFMPLTPFLLVLHSSKNRCETAHRALLPIGGCGEKAPRRRIAYLHRAMRIPIHANA